MLFGARASAAFRGALPLFFFTAFLVTNDGRIYGTKVLIALGILIVALWRMRGAFKPKHMVLDHLGLHYQPVFFAEPTRVYWPQITDFAIKGSGKHRTLVCHYLHQDTGAKQSLNLGDGWSADGTDMFADRLDKVCDHLEEARKRYQLTTQSASVSAQRPLVEVAKKPAPKTTPQQATAPVRSGQVYAKTNSPIKAPPINLSRITNEGASKFAGWGLVAIGSGVGLVSAYAFMKACQNGLCGQGLWDMPDARLWIIFAVWAACLWGIWAGMRKITS